MVHGFVRVVWREADSPTEALSQLYAVNPLHTVEQCSNEFSQECKPFESGCFPDTH